MTTKTFRAALAVAILVAALGFLLSGCGDFRQQALQAQARLDETVQRAEIAEQAAARNAARILELGHRIDALEAAVAALQGIDTND